MDIPFYLFLKKNDSFHLSVHKIITLEVLEKYEDSVPKSMNKYINENIDKFSKEEILFINELLEGNDYSNRIIAFEIIKSK